MAFGNIYWYYISFSCFCNFLGENWWILRLYCLHQFFFSYQKIDEDIITSKFFANIASSYLIELAWLLPITSPARFLKGFPRGFFFFGKVLSTKFNLFQQIFHAGRYAVGDIPKISCQIGGALWDCSDWKWDRLSPSYSTKIYRSG